jgi:hypothetical protein
MARWPRRHFAHRIVSRPPAHSELRCGPNGRGTLRPPEVRHTAKTRYPQANFNIPRYVLLRFGTFICRFAKSAGGTNIATSYRLEHFRDGKMLLSFQIESDEFNCLGQFEILTMSKQLMGLRGRRVQIWLEC